jgi:hypothetical protein
MQATETAESITHRCAQCGTEIVVTRQAGPDRR